MVGTLEKNLNNIQQQIMKQKATDSKLVDPAIVAISKKQSVEKIREAYGLGLRHFGENYWQEAKEKIATLSDLDIHWHFVGALQSKKIKEIVGQVFLIQTVSRLVELEKIAQVAHEKNVTQKILVQVNIASEESKSGISPEDLVSFCKKASEFPEIELCGLMVFPPLEKNVEKSVYWFQKSKELFDEIPSKLNVESWKILSMGTSSDYLQAFSCGATHLRIGESLMGSRPAQD